MEIRLVSLCRKADIPDHEQELGLTMALQDALEQSSAPADLPHGTGFWALTLGSVGVVYGDIGTSPLYALREGVLAASAGQAVQRENVIGILSLMLWSLAIIVTLKYVFILLRADNNGEGGILSLFALAQRALGRSIPFIFFCGAAGAALFYGDALITPALSVLSAVEGLKLVTSGFDAFILPITIMIIFGLFFIQSRGTAAVARWFGPITLVWFAAMALGGITHIADDPGVLEAVNPYHAVRFLTSNGMIGLIALGAVFLTVTGAEALYADLGHFGRRPIQFAWLAIVFPSLAINYTGQAALVAANPAAIENPFFLLYPDWALLPVVILATMATIIASQAVITGAYSLTRQAIQLRILPRMALRHTSADHQGQIYMPQVNLLLMTGVLALVMLFGSSSSLATAYGIAVTGTMVVTCCLAFIVVWKFWNWPVWAAALLMLPFLVIDLVFLGANLMKILSGGYVPLMFAAIMMLLMYTWVRGTAILAAKSRRTDVPLRDMIGILENKPPVRVPGTAVFLTSDPETTPVSLMHSLRHYKVLHESNVILTVVTVDVPRIADHQRVEMKKVSDSFSLVTMTFGYMEEPNVPHALGLCRQLGWKFDIMSTSFFVSRRSLRPSAKSEMPFWQDRLFIALARNASDATDYFHIPTGRVVEIGTQIVI
jgi:KUP system potassium uptake protein